MLTFLVALSLAAPPSTRLSYEAKCLYCHSAEVAESRKLTEPQWGRLIERMRLKAPLLISRTDVTVLARFMAQTLKLVPAGGAPKPVEVARPVEVVKPVEPDLKKSPTFTPDFLPMTAPHPPQPSEELASGPTPEELALEQQATQLISQRCSKCHSLGRVYGRLDTLERSLATLERMRFKTGSGITSAEHELLEKYLRSQF